MFLLLVDTKSFPLCDSEQRFCFSKLVDLIFRYQQSCSQDDAGIKEVAEWIITVSSVCVCAREEGREVE